MGEAHSVGLWAGTALTAGLCGLQQGEAVTCQAHPRGGSIPSFQALWETQYNLLPPEGGSECPLKDGCSASQSCPSLGDPTDCSLQSSSVHGTLQKRILEWIAILSSRGNLPNPGIEPRSPALQADSFPSHYFWGQFNSTHTTTQLNPEFKVPSASSPIPTSFPKS